MSAIPLTPRAAAAVLMDESENNVERAKAHARRVLTAPAYAELRTILWQSAIDGEIDQLWRSTREVVKRETERGTSVFRVRESWRHAPVDTQPAYAPTLSKGEVSTPSPLMMSAVRRSVGRWLAFAMPNGTKLEDWTKRNLREHGNAVMTNGKAAVRTGAFFLSVAEMLPKDESRVGDVLVEADLERLWKGQALLSA